MPKKVKSRKNVKRTSKNVKSTSKNVKHTSKNVKRTSKSKNSGKGRKLNAFFTRMLQAKKENEQEFVYNGKTYKQFTAKTGLKMYKKA